MTSCSRDALDAHEPLDGTAPYATAWIVIEQPGPWGRDALSDSHLDRRFATHLMKAKGTGVSVLLARHRDRPERAQTASRHVWVARSAPGGVLMRHAEVDSLEALLTWDLTAIGAGSLPAFGTVARTPVTFICTHSGRDRCCAVHGRALVNDLMSRLDAYQRSHVWECSHIGGHRFAPVSLTLPSGAVHGRLDVESVLRVVEGAPDGRVVLAHLRGRSALTAPLQVAATAAQRQWAVEDVDALDVLHVVDGSPRAVRPPMAPLEDDAPVVAEVRHADGRSWRAVVTPRALERERMESCGKSPVPGIRWECGDLVSVDDWR